MLAVPGPATGLQRSGFSNRVATLPALASAVTETALACLGWEAASRHADSHASVISHGLRVEFNPQGVLARLGSAQE
jgi:hypothetical protein